MPDCVGLAEVLEIAPPDGTSSLGAAFTRAERAAMDRLAAALSRPHRAAKWSGWTIDDPARRQISVDEQAINGFAGAAIFWLIEENARWEALTPDRMTILAVGDLPEVAEQLCAVVAGWAAATAPRRAAPVLVSAAAARAVASASALAHATIAMLASAAALRDTAHRLAATPGRSSAGRTY